MKAILGLMIGTLLFANIASAKGSILSCFIGQSYSFKFYTNTGVIDIWELASSMGTPIGPEDKVVKADQASGKLRLTTNSWGVIDLDFNNVYKVGEGTWNHRGVLNKYFVDESYYNQNGVAELHSCSYGDY